MSLPPPASTNFSFDIVDNDTNVDGYEVYQYSTQWNVVLGTTNKHIVVPKTNIWVAGCVDSYSNFLGYTTNSGALFHVVATNHLGDRSDL